MYMPLRIRRARRSGIHPGLLPEGENRSGPLKLSADERLFALGSRTLADLIAPAGAEVRRDHLQLDAHYLRVLVVTAYPRTVSAGWLAPHGRRIGPATGAEPARPPTGVRRHGARARSQTRVVATCRYARAAHCGS
jgi:hypothetical protein